MSARFADSNHVKRSARSILLALVLGGVAVGGCHSNKKTTVTPSDPAKMAADARAQTSRAYELIQAGNFKTARGLLETAIGNDPQYGPAQNDMGVIDYREDRLYDAAWHFENAIKLMPLNPEPANNLGLVYEKAGKLAEAEKQYDAASRINLQNVEFAANRARVRIKQGKTDLLTWKLLDYIRLYDPRPEWVEWARLTLARTRFTGVGQNTPEAAPPATQP